MPTSGDPISNRIPSERRFHCTPSAGAPVSVKAVKVPIWLIVEESVNNKTDAGASRHPELLLGSTGRTAPYAEAPQEKRRSCRACKSGKMGLAFRWKVSDLAALREFECHKARGSDG